MSFEVAAMSSGSDGPKTQRSIAKKGPRVACLTGLIDIGIQPQEYKGEKKQDCREFLPVFHLLNDKFLDEDGVAHEMVMSPFFGITMKAGSDKSGYVKFCRALDPEEQVLKCGVGDLSALIGRKCYVNVKHSDPQGDEGIVYGNYNGVSELPEDYPLPDFEFEPFIFDTQHPDAEKYESLWDSTKQKIQGMVNYDKSAVAAICSEGATPRPQENPQGADDDDIPF